MIFARLDGFHEETWVVRNGLISPCCITTFSNQSLPLGEQYTRVFFESMLIVSRARASCAP